MFLSLVFDLIILVLVLGNLWLNWRILQEKRRRENGTKKTIYWG